tara:strand:- start:181 stop:492 length:312 start_codon:yes stop_codon:yes gene_type:complete
MEEFYWFCGIIEGEGCICITGGNVYLQVGMMDKDIIERCAKIMDCKVVERKTRKMFDAKRRFSLKTQYKRGKELMRLLERMYPIMGVRRRAKIEKVLRLANYW